ncbi:MAG: pre-peptidase C-terminal domain-containing protein [Verrucomicrobiae bacterium]|nr:pre-peptidase C-terminal domain-containing protein [Verrucomicrobiae bacterium]
MKPLRQFLLALALGSCANAQLASLQLDTVFPPGAQSGTTVEVTLSGQDMDELEGLMFSHAGIVARHIDGNQFEVTVGADVPADEYEVRVTGRFGLSNARLFQISPLPQVNETGTHPSAETAMALPLDTWVNGTADADASDFYKVTVGAGQRVFINCFADRLDSRMDATLEVTDASGAELQQDRDSYGRDPFLDFTAPAAGDYFVSVHDFQFQGSGNHCYRLAVTTGTHVDYIMPPSGTPGKRERFTIYGRNLPGSGPVPGIKIDGKPLERKEIEIDVPAEPDRLLSRAIAAAGAPGAAVKLEGVHGLTTLPLAQAPVILEREPNNASTNAQLVSVPCEIGGQFFPANDSDWFEFDGRKGQTYWVEVFSERLGDATDPFLAVQKISVNGEGKENPSTVVEGDDIDEKAGAHIFPGKSRDARVTFTADADARYRVLLREQFSGGDPRHTYRLAIREPQPGFSLIVTALQFTDEADQMSRATPYLRRNGSQQLKAFAHRKDGFNGPIEVSIANLPAGIQAQPCTIPQGANEATLTLTAGSDAPSFTGTIDVRGTADIGGKKLTKVANGAALLWGVGNWKQEFTGARLSNSVALAVSGIEQVPVALSTAEDKIYESSLAGTLEIPLQLTRRDDIKDKATVLPVGLPGLNKPPSIQIDNSNKDAKLVINLKKADGNDFKPGEYTIFAQTSGIIQYRANLEAQQRAEASKKEHDASVATIEAEHKTADDQCKALTEELTKLDEQITKQALTAEEGANLKTAKQLALEQATKTRDEKVNALEAAKKLQADAEAELNRTTERAKPQERRFHTISQPIRIRIAPAPVTLPELAQQTIKPGAPIELPVKIERLFGFNEAVELSVNVPEQVKGLSAPAVSIAKDTNETTLVITAVKETTPGDKELRIDAKLKLNDEELTVSRTLKIHVEG